MRATLTFASAIVLVCLAAGAEPAHAACKRFGFTVNDYGKEGPIRDAKALLDKHIAKWASDKGITDYQTGKKDVSCELFLNFIVFDEHTCTASANVCWGGDQANVGGVEEAEGPPPTPVRKHASNDGAEATPEAAPASTAAEAAETITPAATDDGAVAPTEKVAAETPASAADALADTMASTGAADQSDEPAKPSGTETAQEPAEEKPPVAGVMVETGTLADNGASAPAGKPSPESPVKTLATYPDKDQAAAAAAAATAAAAAERAAAAAESAAAAAKEAAAAAVAASAASRGSIVPPLDPLPGADKAARAGTMGAH